MQRYLRKADNGRVFVWTPMLAARDDMMEVFRFGDEYLSALDLAEREELQRRGQVPAEAVAPARGIQVQAFDGTAESLPAPVPVPVPPETPELPPAPTTVEGPGNDPAESPAEQTAAGDDVDAMTKVQLIDYAMRMFGEKLDKQQKKAVLLAQVKEFQARVGQ